MELYLDSANLKEIEEGFTLGILDGLTTTPTFMQKEGVADIDAMILKLSGMVPVLQIEALGNTADDIVKEAKRQLMLGLDPEKTVFKIPVSLGGVKACRMLRKEGLMVNIHLVYTLQQAYMAMKAGATFVCPLVGRLQDQGHDALAFVKQCVDTVQQYKYNTKIMFSSVRNIEHVRNALAIGVHAITVPLKILKLLTDNHFTTLGTEQFLRDTRLMTLKVRDVINGINPVVPASCNIKDAIVKMTTFGFGAVIVVDNDLQVKGVFTDGDLRRYIQRDGIDVIDKQLGSIVYKAPVSIEAGMLLNDAAEIFKKTNVDTIMVTEQGKPVGMLDVQDMDERV